MTWKVMAERLTFSRHDTEDDAINELRRLTKEYDEKVERLEEEIQEAKEFSDSLKVEKEE